MKLDILAIGAHPDDVELGCGGTLAKEIRNGKTVGILDLTKGELGTRGTDETRRVEANDAKDILGVVVRENLGIADGFFLNDKENQLKIVDVIRKYQPDIILSNAPHDRHPDHGKGSDLVNTAIFLSGLPKIENGLAAWRPKKHFHYIQWLPLEPHFVVDISGFIDTKVEACMAYKTQFFDPNSSEPQTPISSKNFTDSIRYRAYDLGRLIGTEAGEGFISRSYIGVNNLDSLI
ncbi:bacillithiol biosynthesis deacetylase BshB1 [Empedobacter falsenii]|uniref:Bacillithiol biosynthesis deacetylase BshB1 n=1 Tax=Empedobacter stercoris TaxID=1628248 RepID=A0ABX1WPV4_9FLAO|nr:MULTISPECIES: bacillithiol biosynthesis deacetylase BshB1 [Empedobacter]MCA4777942.1 bacillithiol biosynthesis deacetylase BshB1 [Empedobacter stercoris]MCA4783225.1 bacillithiol biosynthesis deacetylase BshB1 [Empedobacter stercoris]MCA4809284.1 bacillithiol biosynthesis deacetylase BshB1 [Empedobacter stercoris]MDM1524092.1 bacillithiol biosynthesis deacetylase BshB1 [Empedobacter sp. 225-1]MDM1544040.1 bacillithiol biosynthesis deacetylase BshB1 [Empedobacter sp. 189-2]